MVCPAASLCRSLHLLLLQLLVTNVLNPAHIDVTLADVHGLDNIIQQLVRWGPAALWCRGKWPRMHAGTKAGGVATLCRGVRCGATSKHASMYCLAACWAKGAWVMVAHLWPSAGPSCLSPCQACSCHPRPVQHTAFSVGCAMRQLPRHAHLAVCLPWKRTVPVL